MTTDALDPLIHVPIGIGMMLNPATYHEIGTQFLNSYPVIYLSGIFLLVTGLAILNVHPLWTPDWRSLVTLIGWVFALAGVWRLIAPQFVPFVGKAIVANVGFFTGTGIVLLALGGFLTFKGYVGAASAASEL